MIGLVTYDIKDDSHEIISLDNLEENRGIGTMLLHQVEQAAQSANKHKVSLITTNDNVHALLFYQCLSQCSRKSTKDKASDSYVF